MSRIEFSEKRLTIDSKYIVDFPYPIEEAFETKEIVVVLLDPDSYPMRGLHKNLLGYDRRGEKLWEAELPRYSRFDVWVSKGPASEASDIYWAVKQREPLIASSFSSYNCKINEATGEIESAEFYK